MLNASGDEEEFGLLLSHVIMFVRKEQTKTYEGVTYEGLREIRLFDAVEGVRRLFFVYAGLYFLIGFAVGLVVYYALGEDERARRASATVP